ncbi:estradiol 17-beta-dehydrogenase 1 isoform X1 [Lates japonicus]|uniref:Estradiol 17-beta-dehydrogenase 1 isoform X1 n=1 Tax=Lates japonicus TaxID=270547 RepID=A0AAD3M7W6_LATJO|nr:estradiol 17-beta-dehydrogenase 1 isoform X1 [Lates japonicus]
MAESLAVPQHTTHHLISPHHSCSLLKQNASEPGSMDKKVVLITGCSSGIGLSLAVRLASDPDKTFKVYATMRNLAKKERLLECVKGLHKGTLDILQMDVTDRQSILDVRDRVVEKRVDILAHSSVSMRKRYKSKFLVYPEQMYVVVANVDQYQYFVLPPLKQYGTTLEPKTYQTPAKWISMCHLEFKSLLYLSWPMCSLDEVSRTVSARLRAALYRNQQEVPLRRRLT